MRIVCIIPIVFAVSAGMCSPAFGDSTFSRGDANADGMFDIVDPIRILSYLFVQGQELPCREAADVNNDGALDITDAIAALSALFGQSFTIPPPFLECGADSPGTKLSCASYAPCPGVFERIGIFGGTVEVTDPRSPIFGAKAVVPSGALTKTASISLKLAKEFPPDGRVRLLPAGKSVRLEIPELPSYAAPTLYLPYNDTDYNGIIDGTQVPEYDVRVSVLNEYTGGWRSAEVVDVDVHANLVEVKAYVAGVYVPFMPSTDVNTGPSVRILTYNTALTQIPMPQFDGVHPVTGDQISDEDRAAYIAAGIRRVDPDIVGLNEVFDKVARMKLINELKPFYPYYVAYLDSEYCDVICIDSGLMLFSKWSFVEPSNYYYRAKDCVAWNGGTDWSEEVCFYDFEEDCEGYDCSANKGAGLVRVKNPYTGEVYNVVFAHTQASYGEDDLDDANAQLKARRGQMEGISKLLKNTLTNTEILSQLTIVIGDLNINGNLFSEKNHQLPPLWGEWKYFFDDGLYINAERGFFACGDFTCPESGLRSVLTDSWRYKTSQADLGRTASRDLLFYDDTPENRALGERLDYVLSNSPHNAMCPQHLAIAWPLGEHGGAHQHSDHLPVVADFSRAGPYCMPIKARVVAIHDRGGTDSFRGEIRHPGSMQWHKITVEGSYAIGVYAGGPSRAGIAVYEQHDLSRPIKPYPGEIAPHYGPKYVLPKPPYYVRIYGQKWIGDQPLPDRTWVGTYRIIVHKLDCSSPLESCPLDPTVSDAFEWPEEQLGGDNILWYTFMTDTSHRGDYPNLTFLLDLPGNTTVPSYSAANFEFEIANTGSGEPPVTPNPLSGRGVIEGGAVLRARATGLDGSSGKEKEYYLKVRRKVDGVEETTTTTFQTSLTYFYPSKMKCFKQDDDLGDDDIFCFMEVDSTTGGTYTCVEPGECTWYWSYLAECDNGTRFPPFNVLGHEQKFVNWIVVNLMEWDGGTPNDYLQPHPNGIHQIEPLAPETEVLYGAQFTWANEDNIDDSTYWYVLHYDLSHKRK